MRRRLTSLRPAASVLLLTAFGGAAAGCAWQPYVVTRGVRHLTGNHTRVHSIVPLATSLRPYRIVEVTPLQNLLGAGIAVATERYIDDRVVDGLRDLSTSPQVIAVSDSPAVPAQAPPAGPPGWSAPTLRIEGFIDDLDSGSLPLRVAELGFNHVAVTVRIRLRDKATSQIIGAASFTAQDDRVTASANVAIQNVAKRIRAYVESGYAR